MERIGNALRRIVSKLYAFINRLMARCVLYDRTGSYDVVWMIAIALGVLAALVNLPVRETAITRGPHRVGASA